MAAASAARYPLWQQLTNQEFLGREAMHRHLNIVVATAVSFVSISTVACADAMPPDIAEKIAALGRVIAVPQTDAIYAPLHLMEPYPGVNVARDVRHGHCRERGWRTATGIGSR